MSDYVKALAAIAQEILDRAKGQIGTHWTDCYKYHLACFAAFAIDALEAAQQEIAALTAEADRAIDQANNLAGDLAVQQTPAVDRDALAAVIHERFNMARGRGGVAPLALADQILAAGILLDAAEVEARGLEGFADFIEQTYPDDVFRPPSAETYSLANVKLQDAGLVLDAFSADLMRRAGGLARARAQQVREGN